jgi:hypothetical protein
MSRKNAIKAVEMATINANTVAPGGYTAINPAGLPNACNIVRIVNRCKDDMTISFDGVTAHDRLLVDGEMQLMAPFGAEQSGFRKLAVAYVKGTTSTGFIHAIGYYQEAV